MTKYYRYRESGYYADGVVLGFVTGYGTREKYNYEPIPNKEIYEAMKVGNPKGQPADCLHEWCNDFGINYNDWLSNYAG